ncbi:MAG: phosphate ABC transporter permease PstA [Clostridiales Family XIII bacterium]|jgi:phosphate transport system permease protein|nr:phosphate ABC transporter permease PstA [Clostridiales Family XIII bacterium]
MTRKAKFTERLTRVAVWGSAAIAFAALFYIIGFILIKGIPHLKPSLFAFTYNSDNVSLFPALVSTVITALLALIVAVPLGVGAAIYLVEYAKRGHKAVNVIRIMAETLAGIPSIIYGLFGLLFFVTYLHWGYSTLAGSITLAIMILPLVLRQTEESLLAVPDIWREGAFGLGAGKLRTVFRVVLPAATPGILAGVLLAIGRIVGETAALIYTSGTVAQIPGNPMQSSRTLSVHMYALSSEGLHMNEGYATAVILLILVVLLNAASAAAAKRITRTQKGE